MKDLTKIKKPFGQLGKKTQAALNAHGGPYLCQSASGKWSDVCNPSWFPEIAYRVKPQPTIKPVTSVRPVDTVSPAYSTQAEIYAAVREFQHNYPKFISDISSKAAIALAALRVPS